jgi:hypothetical protein
MTKTHALRNRLAIMGCALLYGATAIAAGNQINITRTADPKGQVEVDNVSGSVEVIGWDRPEIDVSGTIGERVERVDLNVTGDHATVRVVLPTMSWGGDGSANLVIHVPQRSELRVSEVSAKLKTHDLSGEQRLRTVSGDIDAVLAAGGSVNTVSGTVTVSATGPSGALEIETVSGGVTVNGSIPDLRVQTVSGAASAKLASVNNVRLKTISGHLDFSGSLAAGAHLEGESVSGSLDITFGATPAADFDVESHTGTIANCFGPAPQTSRYGPGSHLVFRNQDGTAHVRLSSLSGKIQICDHPE